MTAVYLLIGSFFFLIFIRVPIVFALGISSIVTAWYLDLPFLMVAQSIVGGINVYVLLAIPFFILAGELMSQGGISDRLVKLSQALVGRFRGGLAMVNIQASMFFGGISGSSVADTSSIGSVMIPMMKKNGYEADYSTAVTVASSVQGVLIPPSHNIILYALVAGGGVSIGQLFLAGIVPGVFLGIALMVFSYLVALKRKYPKGEPYTLRATFTALRESMLGLMTVLIVVVGVVVGIFTATEAAAIAVVYAFIVTFIIYRDIPLSRMNLILKNTLGTISIVFILIGTSSAFGYLMNYLNVTSVIGNALLNMSDSKVIILLLVNLIMLILGTFMDMAALILLITPVLLPVVTAVGMDPVHFGVVMMLNLGIGLLTPPVGGTLFVGSAISGVSIERLSITMLPFYFVMIAVLLIITFIPEIVMFVPSHFMK
ncbi:TRAP transporter large permease [Alkalihalobacillus oceani]|uniref:TRAP transporter large permease n=1 Tax=Halalkalibacter oceani TaxID=1653776 RepID=A0A9X2IR34_9BACI|nr:TRAP transporter large permease [Halalkalibacter oceani]MCM3716077.1 TRAP transporter large permease [Halalkalibacter oceani]